MLKFSIKQIKTKNRTKTKTKQVNTCYYVVKIYKTKDVILISHTKFKKRKQKKTKQLQLQKLVNLAYVLALSLWCIHVLLCILLVCKSASNQMALTLFLVDQGACLIIHTLD